MPMTPKRRAYRARLRRKIANARERDAMINNQTTPPDKGWFLLTKRTLTLGDQVFPPGAKVSAADCGLNLHKLLETGAVRWAAPGTPVAAKSSPLPKPPKPAPKPEVEIVGDPDDPVSSYRKSLELLVERCGGDAALANDRMMASKDGRDLYLRAVKIACSKEAQKRGKVSISPSLIGM
jgi:hypothetical protein